MKSSNHLWQRGRQYYLKLAIPRKVRHHFPSSTGTPRSKIVEPLSDSYEVAKVKAAQRVARYLEVFARLKAGEQMTPEQIEAAVDIDPAGRLKRAEDALRAFNAEDPTRPSLDVLRNLTDAAKGLAMQLGERAMHATTRSALPEGETIGQAAEAWFADMQRDPSAAVKKMTLEGHRLRVRTFVEHCGDISLASVTRANASDFLAKIAGGRSNRTTNIYATTLAMMIESARKRGRFQGDNPFKGQRRKVGKNKKPPFQVSELQALFDSLARDVKPAKHTPETALPWVSLIAAFTGMRLEEITQLTAADIHDETANGSTVTVLHVHNGGHNSLKNESSARKVPLHSELFRAGLLQYRDALPKGSLLFPGLKRRASKDGKIGARIGELFGKKLKALGLKRPGLSFHSLRHTVAERLEGAAVSKTDAARVLGHTIEGETFGVYSSGPGLKRLAAVVEEIAYPGLKLHGAGGVPTTTASTISIEVLGRGDLEVASK
jgi:integrase